MGEWPEPFAVEAERDRGGVEVARLLPGVLGLEQQLHLDRRQPGVLEHAPRDAEVWTGGPREVVHIGSPIPVVPIGAVAGRDLTLGATRRRLRVNDARQPVAPTTNSRGTVMRTS